MNQPPLKTSGTRKTSAVPLFDFAPAYICGQILLIFALLIRVPSLYKILKMETRNKPVCKIKNIKKLQTTTLLEIFCPSHLQIENIHLCTPAAAPDYF